MVAHLTNSLTMHGQNNGKKVVAVRIMKHTLEAWR
jgi:small subunit ribosomal protein S5e